VPASGNSLTFGATAVDYGGNIGTAPNVTVQLIPDPLTSVNGRVVDQSNAPVAGAQVSALGVSGTTAGNGTYSLTGLPTIRGPIVVTAVATIGGVLMGGVSQPAAPIAGGVISLADIQLGPKPFISSVTPTAVLAGTNAAITVSGSNFGGSTFAFTPVGITVNTATVSAAGTSAALAVSVAAGATGRFTLIATNPAGVSDSTPAVGFILNPPPFNSISVPGSSGAADPDNDGLTNAEEITNGTDPLNGDTDGDGHPDGLEVALASNPRSAGSVPNPAGPSGAQRYVASKVFSMLNSVNPGAGISGTPQYVTSKVFSMLNSVNPGAGISGTPQYVTSKVFSMLNSVNPSAGTPGSTQYVSSFTYSILNSINPGAGVSGSAQYVTSRVFSLLNTVNPAPAGPVSFFVNSPNYSILNGSALQTNATGRNRYLGPETVARLANPAAYQDSLRIPADTDQDGISDEDEARFGTNPTERDSDHDGYPDGIELVLGSDPLDPASVPNFHSHVVITSPAVSILNGGLQANRNPATPVALRRNP
jgi:hypothetical protein